MASIITKAVFGLMEKALDEGEVLAVRTWPPGTMVEVDFHLPGINLSKWKTIHRLIVKVGEGKYRDYTPAVWNAQTKTCTVYIEAAHEGPGSTWAKTVTAGETIVVGQSHASAIPTQPGAILGLADGSALGHLLALKQLTSSDGFPLRSVVFLADDFEVPEQLINDNPEFHFIKGRHGESLKMLSEWVEQNDVSGYASVCLAGQISMIKGLKKLLRDKEEVKAKFYTAGFWK